MERTTTEWRWYVDITVNDVRVGLVGPCKKVSDAWAAADGVKATLREPHLAECWFTKSWRTPRQRPKR